MAQSNTYGNNNSGCGNTVDSNNSTTIHKQVNKTVHKTFQIKHDEDKDIKQWLSPLEPKSRHQGVRTDRVPGIGDWLLERDEFREWRQSEGGADKAVLFCYGNPGVGKTYLR